MDLCVNDEILDLFRLVQQRNVLARTRFNKRQRFQYLCKILDKKLNNRLIGKHLLTPVNKLKKDVEFARSEYSIARKELASFTKENRHLRLSLQKKYKTKQCKTACNTVSGVFIEFLGSKLMFSISDINRIVLETEIDDILLGLPQI
jgi:hypothetical protein